jgi:hypothetical protein
MATPAAQTTAETFIVRFLKQQVEVSQFHTNYFLCGETAQTK